LPSGAVASGEHAVRPIHGITVRVRGIDRSTQPMIRSFVRGATFYMVSRPGGYNVLGASSEERLESGAQVGEVQRLLRDALDVVPALETAVILETREGNRPASDDLRPFFEVLDGGRWAWSSGHFRHGVTLAPLAANEALRFVESAT
jgi:glycine/D-amino acid oxidase-like deaminating enzyme